MTNMRPIIYISVLSLALAGCGSKKGAYTPVKADPISVAKVEAGNEASLFPLKVGNSWTYTLDIVRQKGSARASKNLDITFKVMKVDDIAGGKKATINIIDPDEKVAETQVWIVNKEGVFQGSSGKDSTPYTPPQPAILFPTSSTNVVSWKGTGITPFGKMGTMTLKCQNLGVQEVDMVNKRISAFCMSSKGDFQMPGAKGLSAALGWFAPNVGMVRTRIEVATKDEQMVQVFKLKEYVVK